MFNLREQIQKDLGVTLEGVFGLPVELIDPDGNEYTTSANSPDPANPLPLMGQILYDTVGADPETGERVVVNNPIVSLRTTSLTRIPKAGERWAVSIPTTPSTTATKETFVITPTRPPEGGASIGFIKLYLQRVAQS